MTEPIVTTTLNYPGNSEKSKTEPEEKTEAVEGKRERPKQVTTGKVVQKPKSLGRKIKETFIAGDDGGSVAEYVVHEVMVPAAKSMIADAFREGVERLLFGGGSGLGRTGGQNRYSSNNYGRPHVSYQNNFNGGATQQQTAPPRTMSSRGRATHNFQEIRLDTRPEAVGVIEQLRNVIEDYSEAQVEDLYASVGITGTFQDSQWGWRDLSRADVRRGRDGFYLVLPDPIPLTTQN